MMYHAQKRKVILESIEILSKYCTIANSKALGFEDKPQVQDMDQIVISNLTKKFLSRL